MKEKIMRLEVTIPDPLFEQANLSAVANGFDSLASYVIDLINHDVNVAASMDNFFTKEIVAEIREAAAEARTGNNVSLEQFQVDAKLRRADWQENRPGGQTTDPSFTHAVLADLDTAAAEGRAGRTYSSEEVELHVAETRAQWLATHQS